MKHSGRYRIANPLENALLTPGFAFRDNSLSTCLFWPLPILGFSAQYAPLGAKPFGIYWRRLINESRFQVPRTWATVVEDDAGSFSKERLT